MRPDTRKAGVRGRDERRSGPARGWCSVSGIGLLALLLAVAPLAAQEDELPFGKRKIRDLVVGQLRDMTGRDLTIEGDIDIDLGWQPSMRIEKVRVANAAWARAPYLLELEALEVRLDMRGLLRGETHLPRLALIGPRLFLEVSEQGSANWLLGGERQTVVEAAAAPEGKPGELPRIDRLQVIGGALRYLDQRDPRPQWVEGEIEEAGGSLDDNGVDIAATGSLGGEPFTIVLRAAPLDALRAGEAPSPVQLVATAGDSRLEVQGTAVAPLALRGIDLALQAHGAGFNRLPLLGGLPESPAFDLSARLIGDAEDWRLEQLEAHIGRSSMTGRLALDLTGQRPRVSADLAAQTLALDELLALVPAGEDAPDTEPSRPGVIELSALAALNADVEVSARRLLYDQLRLEQVRGHLTLEDGVLRLRPLAAAADGGRISTRATLRAEPLQGQARIELTGVELAQVLRGVEPARSRLGQLDGVLAVALPPPEDESGSAATITATELLERLRVEQGRVRYRESEQDTEIMLTLAAGPAAAGPQVEAEGRFRGAGVAADLSADPLRQLVTAQRYALDGRVRIGASEASIDAAILSPPDLDEVKVDFDISGDLEQLADLTGAPLPALPPVDAEGVLRRDGAQWVGKTLDIRMGASDLSGRVELDTGGARPQVTADLASDTLDLETLLPEPDPAAADDGEIRIPPVLNDIDARLDYQADRILTGNAVISDLSIDTRLEDGRLRLGPLRLGYRQPEQETRLSLRLRAPDATRFAALTGAIDGRLLGNPIDAALRADAWLDLTEQGPPGAWQVRLTPADTELRIAGRLRDLLSPETLELNVAASGPGPAQLSDLIGVPLPDLPPYQVNSVLRRDGRKLTLSDLDAQVGDSDVDGRIDVDFANVPTAVHIELASDRLDYDDLTELLTEPDRSPVRGLFPDEPLHLGRLGREVQGSLSYRARTVVAAEVPLDDLRLDASLRDGLLELSPLRFGVGGGRIGLHLDLDTTAEPPTADLEGEIERVDLRRVLNPFGITDESVGIVGGQLQVWMQGDSIADLAGSADGGLFLLMTDGVFEQLLVELAGLDAGEALLALLEGDRVPIDCAYVNLHSRDGQVEVETLAVDTRDTLFVGGGEIDLGREWLELVVEPRPKDQSLPAFSSPLRLRGPLSDPELDLVSAELIGRGALAIGLTAVQPLVALLPLIETGAGGESPYCSGLMESLREARR